MYLHSAVNDLAFILFAPELMQHHFKLSIEATPARLSWLRQLDENPKRLFQINTKQPLGRYYESLWALFFEADEQFDLIAKNLVLQGFDAQGMRRTLGEFDFIIFDKTHKRYYHLEVAIKYYLFFDAHPSLIEREQRHWFGPNSQDNLERKWQHLLNKQSVLSTLPEAKALLESLHIPPNTLERKISAKGYLFHRQADNEKLGSEHLPDSASPQTLSPYYFINETDAFANQPLYFITKRRWLSQTHHSDDISLITVDELIELLAKKQSPVLLAYGESIQGVIRESERFFVCPEAWPYCLIKPFKSLESLAQKSFSIHTA